MITFILVFELYTPHSARVPSLNTLYESSLNTDCIVAILTLVPSGFSSIKRLKNYGRFRLFGEKSPESNEWENTPLVSFTKIEFFFFKKKTCVRQPSLECRRGNINWLTKLRTKEKKKGVRKSPPPQKKPKKFNRCRVGKVIADVGPLRACSPRKRSLPCRFRSSRFAFRSRVGVEDRISRRRFRGVVGAADVIAEVDSAALIYDNV
jgi:hypothetical protein